MKKFKALLVVTMILVMTCCSAVPVMAASKKGKAKATETVDGTLAISPVFMSSQYVLLNPTVAMKYNGDMTKMYNHYMSVGVRNGERLFATPTMTPIENLFLYMSYNRAKYVQGGLTAEFPYFNVQRYMANNTDLVSLLGTNTTLWLYHYLNFGIYEGRGCGTNLDPARVILFNNALAAYNNTKLDPAKVIENYKTVSGQSDTSLLSSPTRPTGSTQNTNTSTTTSTSSSHTHDWKYESIDDTQHKKKCKVDKCNEEVKEDHEYKVESYYYNGDASKHTLKCEKCDHKRAEWHYDNNYDGVCDVCGYSLHRHSYAVDKSQVNAKQHRVVCACGASQMVNHTAKYTYNGGILLTHNVTCSGCGYEINPAEACDTKGKDGACSKCKHKAEPTHTHDLVYTSNNNGTHNGACKVAGCTYVLTNEVCDTLGTDGKCSKCGYSGAPAHVHEWGNWSSNNDGTHTRYCTDPTCTAFETESCDTLGTDGACSQCGYKAHEHQWSAWKSNNAGRHSHTCQDITCGATESEECDTLGTDGVCSKCGYKAHEHQWGAWTPNNLGQHTRTCQFPNCTAVDGGNCDTNGTDGACSVCGYKAHVHNYGEWISNNNGNHKRTCQDPSCGNVETGTCDTDGTDGACSKCGYKPHVHNYGAWVSNNDGTHKRTCQDTSCGNVETGTCDTNGTDDACSVCGYKAHVHSYGAWVSNNDGTHKRTCQDPSCGYVDIATCDTNGAEGACSVCGYKAHVHSYGEWVSNNDGTHKRTCQDPACNNVETGFCDTNGAEGACSVCGYKPHVHSYANYVSNNDGTHQMTCQDPTCGHVGTEACDEKGADGACSHCGYKAPAQHTHVLIYTPLYNGTHSASCTGCDYVLTSEPCDTDGPDGKCSKCLVAFTPVAPGP